MRNKIVFGLSITITALTSTVHAKKIFPSDVMARELKYPAAEWAGHVGIATSQMLDSSGMSTPANLNRST